MNSQCGNLRRTRWQALFLVLAVAAASSTSLGCASAPRSNVRSNIDVMQRERTADKLLERGRAFAAVGDHTRAEQYLSMALDAGGDDAQIVPLLLRACIDGERYLVALEYARASLQKNPDDMHLRFMVASLEAAVGNEKAAATEFRTLIETDPDDAEAHFALASLVHDSNGDPDEANQHFREYLRLSPDGAHAREARASMRKEVP
jgi:tetratricopeptide (TPR) repeat protein